ncbi:hypothetical protein V1290_004552 [Bradyrhizobium sp. AZCC 1578]
MGFVAKGKWLVDEKSGVGSRQATAVVPANQAVQEGRRGAESGWTRKCPQAAQGLSALSSAGVPLMAINLLRL